MSALRGRTTHRSNVDCLVKQIRILIDFSKLLFSVVLFELIHAFFEDLTDAELILWHFLVLQEETPYFLFLAGKTVPKRWNHLVAFIELYLNERLNLIYDIDRGEYVTSIQ